MKARFAQIEKQTRLPARRGATEGGNDFVPPDAHTVTHTAEMGGHAERPFNALGAQPQVGLRGIRELTNQFVEKGFRPEENIRTFEGALGYLFGTSPEQFLAAYRGFFPLPMKPGFDLGQAWGNFVAWVHAIRRGGNFGRTGAIGQTAVLSASGGSGGERKTRSQLPNPCPCHRRSQKR
ncbi:hypothetical protein DQ04_08211010 [Trypanosoma grayi]|uniref:hypothetical protein n=1 Tax=Trypanosoma grayi TaxID=71804 RepID=UPI0004F4AE2B|nr:hypothetical protein DQ04_08211010 [Trypanosoma grayi]KEG08012.1 hypothetical protein DQ04_08211010 [Trypanosoma grayi]